MFTFHMEFPARTGETVLSYVRPTRPIYRESSLSAALEALRESSSEMVPVLDGPFVVGAVWASAARGRALSNAAMSVSVESFFDAKPPVIQPNAPIDEALWAFSESDKPSMIVADVDGRYLGTISALDLFHRPDGLVRPPFIGGMATPFGVFLTNGEISGGAKPFALAATGAMLFSLLLVAVLVSGYVLDLLGHSISSGVGNFIFAVLPPLLFFSILRAIPLSGTHGAEHMVVHAIERREPLTVDVVRRMPRVHPRCGTNFAIGAMMFTALIGWSWPHLGEVGALLSLVATLILWRPLGAVFQQYVTTKPPTKRQLEGAIAAGEELLAKYRASAHPVPSFFRRLAMSGMPYVLVGSMTAYLVVYWGLVLFNVDPKSLGLG